MRTSHAVLWGAATAVLLGGVGYGVAESIDAPQPKSYVHTVSNDTLPAVPIHAATTPATDPACTVVGAGNPVGYGLGSNNADIAAANSEIDRLWGLYGGESDPTIKSAIATLHDSQHPDPDLVTYEGPVAAAHTLIDNFNDFTHTIANECTGE